MPGKASTFRLNPDDHWSTALYMGLNQLEYVDGRDMVNVNPDDSIGFRLDTLTTCTQYKTPVVQGQEVLTTQTDYVNKHPSVHRRSVCRCCKGIATSSENPAQHIADLCLLESKEELKLCFSISQLDVQRLC